MISLTAFSAELQKLAAPSEEDASGKQLRRNTAIGVGGTGAGYATQIIGSQLLHSGLDSADPADRGITTALKSQAPSDIQFLTLPNKGPDGHGYSIAAGHLKGGGFATERPLIAISEKAHNAPGILAHELGHAAIDRHALGGLIQNTPVRAIHANIGSVGAMSGALTSLSDDERVRAAGRWAPLALSAPKLLSEAGATLHGLHAMHGAGATGAQLLRGAGLLAPAFATYAGHAGIGVGMAHASQALGDYARRESKEASHPDENAVDSFNRWSIKHPALLPAFLGVGWGLQGGSLPAKALLAATGMGIGHLMNTGVRRHYEAKDAKTAGHPHDRAKERTTFSPSIVGKIQKKLNRAASTWPADIKRSYIPLHNTDGSLGGYAGIKLTTANKPVVATILSPTMQPRGTNVEHLVK